MKKIFSLLLAVVMTFSLLTPVISVDATEYSEDILIKLEGREATVGDKKGVIFDWNMQMSSFQGTQILAITYDSSKLTLTNTAGQVQPVTAWSADLAPAILQVNYSYNDETGETSGLPGLEGYSRTLKGNANNSNHKNTLYISFGTGNSGSKQVTDFADALKRLGSFRFQLNDGVNYSDLDSSTVRWATIPEMSGEFKIDGAVVVSSADGQIAHNVNSTAIQYKFKTEPTIAYPNSDVINLNGVKVDASQRYVNVPVSLPSAAPDVTVQASAQGYSDSDCVDGTEITSGVTFEYSVAMKDGSDLPETVSIDKTTGELTVKAGAPEAVVTITATGTYTENGSTASGTFDVSLRHGDAGKMNEEDPTEPKKEEPKKENDVTPVASGVVIYESVSGVETQVASSVAATPYEKAVAIPAAGSDPKTLTFVGKVVDQYGDVMTEETGSWAVDAAAPSGNPAFSDGTVTVSPSADKGTYPYNYTSTTGTYTATAKITVDDTAITWPTLTKDTIVYGQTVSEFAPTGGSLEPLAEGTTAEFVWATDGTEDGATAITDNTVLNAGSHTLVMQCKVGADVKGTHNYSVTVDKADQVITVAGDTETAPRTSLKIPRGGNGFDLQTTVTNKTVPAATDTSTPTYTFADPTIAQMGTEAGRENVVTGLKISDTGTDLTITADGNDNYNSASRTLTVSVGKELLDAQITLTPADNLIFAQTVTATVKQNPAQPGSLTTNTEYKWQRVDTEGIATDISGATGKLVVDGEGNADDITYTATAADVGYRLRFVVSVGTADKDNSAYEYADMSIATMTNPVAKATWGTITGSVKSVTTTSVTVQGEADAWFAIAVKNAPVGAAEEDEPVFDGHAWVSSVDGTDVTFTTDDAGNALTPNTEYTVFMKKEAAGYETANTTFDAKTAKDSLTPTPTEPGDPDYPNPIPPTITGVTVAAAIDETGGLKFGNTLTASVTVTDTVPHDPVITIANDQWEYKWYRVTPAEGETPETEQLITVGETADAYTGDTYTLAEADIGKVIRVKAVTKDTCEYTANANDDTSAVIAKADGDVLTADGFAATKATSADATDGTITIAAPADLTKTYEYRLKAAEGAEENHWAEATIVDGVLVDNLGVGTYEVRIKETATKNASNAIELDVQTAGFDITGVIYSYNAANEIHYTLYTAYDTETHTGTALSGHENVLLTVEMPESTAGDHEQAFTIKSVPSGTYTLVMTKTSHVDLRIYNVVVGSEALDLTKYVARFEMGAGDMNADGYITAGDGNLVTLPSNFGKDVGDDGVNPVADMNGDGSVTAGDGNIVTLPKHFGFGADHFEVTVNYSAS